MALDDAAFLGVWPDVALWFGHEGRGLSDAVKEAADAAVHIEMRGSGDSLSVSAAVPIAVHELLRRRRAAGRLRTLDAAEQAALYERLRPASDCSHRQARRLKKPRFDEG